MNCKFNLEINGLLAISCNLPGDMKRDKWVLSDFVITKQLYKGDKSEVYCALCNHSCRYVVLKVYTRESRKRLFHHIYREIAIHIKLDHPHIIKLYAAFVDEDKVVLVQEYKPCVDLYKFLKHKGRLSENRLRVSILPQLLSAVHYLHSNNICHRDIKAENILICENSTVLLCDFGISIDMLSENPTTRCGTEYAMAPEVTKCPLKSSVEQYKDRSDLFYGTEVDIWSIGILTYELYVGIIPFVDCNLKSCLPTFPATMKNEVVDFISACLNRSPALRPSAVSLLKSNWLLGLSIDPQLNRKSEER